MTHPCHHDLPLLQTEETAISLLLGGIKDSAIITINATGIIQSANKNAQAMFGYKKVEMEGSNVSMLMPAPFSQRHNTYLKNYLTTGGGAGGAGFGVAHSGGWG